MHALRRPLLPSPSALPARHQQVLALALGVFGLVLPFTVAGTSVLLAVLLLLGLAAAPAVWRSRPWREPAMAFGLLLLAYVLLHTLLLTGSASALRTVLMRYKELALAPVLFALYRLAPQRDWFFRGLVLGTLGYALVTWAGLLHERLGQVLLSRRIAAGFEFSVMAFLLLERARSATRRWPWLLGAAFLALTVLVAVDGRTGQVVLLLLLAHAAWTQSPRRWRLAAAVLLPVAAATVALMSGSVQKRMGETLNAFRHPPAETFTSSAIRAELIKHGLTLAKEHWLLGGGYTRYAEMHQDAVRRAYRDDPARQGLADQFWARAENPHDEYLMHLVGGGLPALLLFLAWLGAPLLREGPDGAPSPALTGLVIAFAAGCLFNSLLMDFVEGHFYMGLMAWLLARQSVPPA
ncbi:MAG TPA: O-antigen ligase family protein [Ramlibacter sp.]|jgi:O-antigen ligase|uniref:O-antigen ligase family protein n=1 Tax=Ramlibacter sp. TaxID=1917967 RepID=UPI002D5BF08B|nr:O-antigen ligase family protein [Ramlibacter sp.]HZY18479.1 O-antigen ligase family protein [Ramlibacter sp.]